MNSRVALWWGGAALAVAVLIAITRKLGAGEVPGFDRALLDGLAKFREPHLTSVALDITALGSPTLLVLFALLSVGTFLYLKKPLAALQIAIISAGAPILSALIKTTIERARPDEAHRLAAAFGFSYPSGHSLSAAAFYFTLSITIGAYVSSHRVRVLVAMLSVVIVGLVALSRIYLAVHYPSDTLAGIATGTSWALLLAGCFSILLERARRAERSAP
jgi:undecaprenyl-diphosphatase